ncbi:Ig-like domain repeat protein [Streptomyces olivochromogenes]|uniref:Ig-like domain repeat protein n=1 Tax=Streptomyces olivochromogenes TaxID=1963 RepID=UPI001F1F0B27|nr:Ig-like domain repeat protein [Streptomyces olivochromogenes]MCF3133795.1 Ig-like domain repeat protein [Streptomyces olivochromogenes]
MMFTSARRTLPAGIAAVLVAGAIGLGASGAVAASLGTLDVSPATGTDTTGMTLTTSAGCPSPATNLIVSVTGSGFPADGQIVVGNSPISAYQTSVDGGIVVPLTQTMRDYANTAGFTTLQGRYDFTLTCRGAFGSTTYGDFGSPIWFTSNTAYQNTDPAGSVTATTTTLTAAPASPVVEGTSVKLTATVAPNTAAGTVQFKDGAQALGSPVPVSSGTASLTTSALAVGSHSLTAEFTPSDASAYAPSTSAALPYTVKIKAPQVVTAPKVTGTVRVGSTVTCSATFSGATSYTYAWLRDGTVIGGATGRTRGLVAADYPHKIACRVTATNSTGSTTATSPSVTVALGPALKNTVRPSITGTPRVGKRLTAKPGSWNPTATSYGYTWKRDGHAIRGATHSTYVLTRGDKRHLITVTVVAKRAGYANGTMTSKSVRVG